MSVSDFKFFSWIYYNRKTSSSLMQKLFSKDFIVTSSKASATESVYNAVTKTVTKEGR